MTTARDLMSSPAQSLKTSDSIVTAAQALSSNDVGSMPVLDENGQLAGILTDRDIVVRGLAQGVTPDRGTVADVLTETVVVVNADDDQDKIVNALTQNQVRRLPVLDGNEVVGMVSQADLARALPNSETGNVVAAISEES
ncbi:CBS domain-containing protein [Calidifontibacter sp. DB0510]|uniref:CBS domain-containing protein n=1 Tax=Metallococcus carri TaxID=1656884 RepID=A0A967B279_9MICO|nr:CBS domain-containing protein [Metallococcus carri]NHN56188.1 CBS domain-containing protein [Metallococcus carri]NOP38761.1 CBS domain-containing protein [Calidifontibacter sp. DB2511S]